MFNIKKEKDNEIKWKYINYFKSNFYILTNPLAHEHPQN
jgi:hypothetical protein